MDAKFCICNWVYITSHSACLDSHMQKMSAKIENGAEGEIWTRELLRECLFVEKYHKV